MTNLFKLITITLLATAGVFAVAIAAPSSVAASDQQNLLGQLCDGPNRPAGANCDQTSAEDGVTSIMGQVINIASWIAGIVSTIVIIIAGMMYVFSGGNPDQTARARSAIIYALVGLAVAFAANILVRFAFNEVDPATPGTITP